jgi:transcriptional regulator with XRE-family HTH domain
MTILDLKALLGAAIKSQRSTLGISQEELAYRAGLHRTYISDVERGARNPSIESIEKLARALEISVSTLFEQAGKGSDARQFVEILLVEDNPRDVRLILRGFEKTKIANPVHVVRDGAEALNFIFATGPYTHRRNVRPPPAHSVRSKSAKKDRDRRAAAAQSRQNDTGHNRDRTNGLESRAQHCGVSATGCCHLHR